MFACLILINSTWKTWSSLYQTRPHNIFYVLKRYHCMFCIPAYSETIYQAFTMMHSCPNLQWKLIFHEIAEVL